MNILLIFFALPIAIIIISTILQKLLKNPITVAALVFAIFLIVTFAVFDETFLIATLAYTILALITALIVRVICQTNNNNSNACDILRNVLEDSDLCEILRNVLSNNNKSNLNTISDILNTNNVNNNNNNSCGCSKYRRYR